MTLLSADCKEHSYHGTNEPRHRNCKQCWQVYFFANPAAVTVAKSGIDTLGKEAVEKVRGTKYVKHLLRFINEVKSWTPTTQDAPETGSKPITE